MSLPKADNLDEANRQIEELSATITSLQGQVAWLSRQLFGRKSERYNLPAEAGLFDDLPQAQQLSDSESNLPKEKQQVSYQREAPATTRGKRAPIPEGLPRIERVHDLPEHEREGMKRIGHEISERIEYEPGKVYVLRDVRMKYARKEQCLDGSQPNVILAPKPDEGLAKCIAGPSLLGHIAVSKYCDHQPLHRLEGILERSGVSLPRSSMCRWMQDLADLCQPVLDLMKERILLSHVIHADETPVKQQHHKGAGKGCGPTKTCYFWSYVSGELTGDRSSGSYILFDYQESRSRAGPNAWFSDQDGVPIYHGFLHCDAYAGYNDLFASPWNMTHLACWAHVRRKFYDVRTQFPGPCHFVLSQIRSLYDVEREARDLDPDSRRLMRQQRSLPIVEQLLAWCQNQLPKCLPKSGLAEAINYLLNQARALQHYLDDGLLAIDNNLCERSLRGIAIGRKNWLFTGSPAGGRAAAAIFSLITSARRCQIAPLAYLTDLITHLPATPLSQIDQFLPNRWRPAKP